MIKCIAKKKLAFRNPANRDELVTVRPFEFATLPDWAEKDPMWAWAIKDKILEVSKEVIVAKTEPVEKPAEEKQPEKKPVAKPARKTKPRKKKEE